VSPLLVHDTGRPGKLDVVVTAITNGRVGGFILSPFETPPVDVPRRPTASETVERIRSAGGEVWMDPAAHLATGQGAARFAIYDEWTLWGVAGGRAVRPSIGEQSLRDHVRRALDVQRGLGLTSIAPTIAIASPSGARADLVRAMADEAVTTDPGVYLSIVGPTSLWASGSALDTLVGELVQLRPAGWYVAVTRDAVVYPPDGMDPLEVAGLCRTIGSLSLRGAPVIAAYGDLPGLPSVAAGASHLGTGGDLKQRCCSEASVRGGDGTPRRASTRVTLRGLLASLKRPEVERLEAADNLRARRLLPGALPPPDRTSAWQHHFATLNALVDDVTAAGGVRDRALRLLGMYEQADAEWDVAQRMARPDAGKARWIVPLREGTLAYARDEGWI
jgi:hypothetical protein